MPFLLDLALSAMAEPLVQRVRRLLKVRRSFAAALVTTFFLLVLGGGAGLVLGRLVLELRQWSARLPEAIAGFPAVWNGLIVWRTGMPPAPLSCAPPWTRWRSS